ncbi:hypothetical protein D9M69_483440 [compost metagenome]
MLVQVDIAAAARKQVGVREEQPLGRGLGGADRLHQLRVGHVARIVAQRRAGIDRRAHLAEFPALDHGDHVVRDFAAHQLAHHRQRRGAGLEFIAAGLQVGPVAGQAHQQCEQPRVHADAAALDLAAGAGHAGIGLDHHFDRRMVQRQRVIGPPRKAAGCRQREYQDRQAQAKEKTFHVSGSG